MSNRGFRRNNADSVLAVEQWTNSLPLQSCLGHLVYMCFVDSERAYDHVPRGTLWEELREYGIPGPVLQAIRSLYNQSESCVSILGPKVKHVSSGCWIPPVLPWGSVQPSVKRPE